MGHSLVRKAEGGLGDPDYVWGKSQLPRNPQDRRGGEELSCFINCTFQLRYFVHIQNYVLPIEIQAVDEELMTKKSQIPLKYES